MKAHRVLTVPESAPYTGLQVEQTFTTHMTHMTHASAGDSREAGMVVMDGDEFLTAQEACAILEIKPATLYAYVSRGLLGSYRQGIKRTRLYRRVEVERLTRLRGPDERDTRSSSDSGESTAAEAGSWIPYV